MYSVPSSRNFLSSHKLCQTSPASAKLSLPPGSLLWFTYQANLSYDMVLRHHFPLQTIFYISNFTISYVILFLVPLYLGP